MRAKFWIIGGVILLLLLLWRRRSASAGNDSAAGDGSGSSASPLFSSFAGPAPWNVGYGPKSPGAKPLPTNVPFPGTKRPPDTLPAGTGVNPRGYVPLAVLVGLNSASFYSRFNDFASGLTGISPNSFLFNSGAGQDAGYEKYYLR